MSKTSIPPPATPDYAAAAKEQGVANLEAARLGSKLSNPNVITPLGRQTVTYGGNQTNKQAYQAAQDLYKQKQAAPQPTGTGTQQPPGAMQPDFQGGYRPSDEFSMYNEGDMAPQNTYRGGYGGADTSGYGGGYSGGYGAGAGLYGMPNVQGSQGNQNYQGGTSNQGQGYDFSKYGNYRGDVAPNEKDFQDFVESDQPTITQTLTPDAQANLEAQQRVERAYSGLGEQSLGRLSGTVNRDKFNAATQAWEAGGRQGQAPTAEQFKEGGLLNSTFAPTGLRDYENNLSAGNVADAPNLMGMGQAEANVQAQGVNYGPQAGQFGMASGGPSAGEYGYASGGPSEGQYGYAQGGPQAGQYGYAGSGPNAPGQIENANYSGLQNVGYGPQEGEYGYASGYVPQQQLNQNINTRGLAQAPINAGMTAQNAIMSRLDPQIKRQRAGVENQLAQQGLVRGGEAYGAAINEQQQQENDLRTQAALQGINLDMAARQQGFGERQTMADFANQAKQNQFGMGVTGAGLRNQAVGQNLGQGLSINQAQNANQGQDFQQRLAAGAFGREGQQLAFSMGQSQQEAANRASGQNFAQAQAAAQSRNQAIGQNFGLGQAAAQSRNQAIGQNFQLGQGASQAQNAAMAQNFNQALQGQGAYNTAAAQAFGQNMDVQNARNAALATNQNTAMQQQQAQNAAYAQRFNQNTGAAQFNNAARQAQLQEQIALRNQPLNEISTLMGGGQIQMPQFQAYSGSTVNAAPTFQGAQLTGQAAQNQYNQQVAAQNANAQGLYSLAGSALTF